MFEDLAAKYSRKLHDEKWNLYSGFFPPRQGERVLDVGVSSMHELENVNYFLSWYPHPEQLTAVGIDDLQPLHAIHPNVTFVRADGRDLPFEDLAFDVVHSNAVVEHVGGRSEQRAFVAELTRVAKAGFITTPNRWFPLESHTRLPLVHWLPRRSMIRAFELMGSSERGIWLLSERRLRELFPDDVQVKIVKNRLAGWPATLCAVFVRL
jgi:hypothetical protein